jgi:rubredoxin-NAD+ reductase
MVFDIIIIGSGMAGYNLAKEFRRLDSESTVLLISADDGRYYSKPMLSTGFAKNKSAEALTMKSAEQMSESLDIKICCSTTVQSVDRVEKTLTLDNDSEKLTYRRSLVLATGAAPMQIPLPAALDGRCMPINDLQDYGCFRQLLAEHKRVTIIGSGLVGTEYANDLSDSGVHVNVVALDDGPLQQLLPKPLSEAVQQQLAQNSIDWHFNNSIAAATVLDDNALQLTLTNGETIITDLVLSAVGLKPRLQIAEQADLAVNRGVVVDSQLRTSDDNIYALGDCAEIEGHILMYVIPLTLSAKALAKTLSGTPTAVKIPASPVIVKTPTCPVVSCLPSHHEQGSWQFEGDAPDLKASFVGENQSLLGFALTGKSVGERMKLAKLLPAIL